jgi:hypothetical protein
MMVFERVCGVLNDAGIAHALIGASALAARGGPPVVLARDLVLLKLYAGGPQDLWDIQELLRQPEGPQLAGEVTADLADLSSGMRQAWQNLRG